MSKLTMQANKLRSWADQLSEREDEFGVVVRALVANLREAADTIESLRDRLQELQVVTSESRYSELFGTPEKAARTLTGICDKVPNCDVCQISEIIGEQCNYEMLLEWLRGDA